MCSSLKSLTSVYLHIETKYVAIDVNEGTQSFPHSRRLSSRSIRLLENFTLMEFIYLKLLKVSP